MCAWVFSDGMKVARRRNEASHVAIRAGKGVCTLRCQLMRVQTALQASGPSLYPSHRDPLGIGHSVSKSECSHACRRAAKRYGRWRRGVYLDERVTFLSWEGTNEQSLTARTSKTIFTRPSFSLFIVSSSTLHTYISSSFARAPLMIT